jgi:hypothetical protein
MPNQPDHSLNRIKEMHAMSEYKRGPFYDRQGNVSRSLSTEWYPKYNHGL